MKQVIFGVMLVGITLGAFAQESSDLAPTDKLWARIVPKLTALGAVIDYRISDDETALGAVVSVGAKKDDETGLPIGGKQAIVAWKVNGERVIFDMVIFGTDNAGGTISGTLTGDAEASSLQQMLDYFRQ
jgi:hypothetical protein